MILLHGTTTDLLDVIRAQGLTRPYLTDDEDIALYYAEVAVEETGAGEPVILEVEVDETFLLPDVNAIDEPVLRDEDEVMEQFALVPDDWREAPDAWRVSLDLVSSVRYSKNVHPL